MPKTPSKPIDQDTFETLISARDALCDYCARDECEGCAIPALIDQAALEAREAGILDAMG